MSSKKNERFEIQIHPGDIRRGVRYLFLSRRQLGIWAAGVLLYFAFIGIALWLAPGVIANRFSVREYRALMVEREQAGKELQPLVERLRELDTEVRSLRLTMDRIYLAYGLESDQSVGQGGYPLPAVNPPEGSIYAGTVREAAQLHRGVSEQLEVLDAFTREVQSFEQNRRAQILTTPSICPVDRARYVLTSPFGNRRNPFTNGVDFHAGIDLAAQEGTPIFAPADATVVFAGRYPLRRSAAWWRYGNLVVLQHGGDFVSLYAHCREVLVRKGQRVQQGDEIATVGNTGLSTNPHLHYEIRRRDESGKLVPVDPRIYMLDLELTDQEKGLVASRNAPSFDDFEPLPRTIAR
ncbi:MAG: M23 family metallopeptidase [Acidobacteriota bacterium]